MANTIHVDVVSAEEQIFSGRGGVRRAARRHGRARHLPAAHAAADRRSSPAPCASRCRARSRRSSCSSRAVSSKCSRPGDGAGRHRDPRQGPRRGQGDRRQEGGRGSDAEQDVEARRSPPPRPSSRRDGAARRRSARCATAPTARRHRAGRGGSGRPFLALIPAQSADAAHRCVTLRCTPDTLTQDLVMHDFTNRTFDEIAVGATEIGNAHADRHRRRGAGARRRRRRRLPPRGRRRSATGCPRRARRRSRWSPGC